MHPPGSQQQEHETPIPPIPGPVHEIVHFGTGGRGVGVGFGVVVVGPGPGFGVGDTPPSVAHPGYSESRSALAAAMAELTNASSRVVNQDSSVQKSKPAVVMVLESVVSVTEQPVVLEQVVLQEEGLARHWTPQDEAVLVEHCESEFSLLLGFLGGLGSIGSGKSVPPPGPQPIRQGLLQKRRQGRPQPEVQGAPGGPDLKPKVGNFGSRTVCENGNGGGVIVLVTGGWVTPCFVSGFGSSVIVKTGGRTLLVTSNVREGC